MRKQAQMTMRCMQALVRVQARVRARRLQLVHDKVQSKLEDEQQRFKPDEEAQKRRSQIRKLENEQWDRRNQSMSKIRESPSRKFHDSETKRDRALAYALAYQVLKILFQCFFFICLFSITFCVIVDKHVLCTYM